MAPSAVTHVEEEKVILTKKIENANGQLDAVKGKTPLEMISHGVSLPGIPKFPSYAQHRQWMLEKMALAFRVFARKGQSKHRT